jgi:biotin carboxyl carrier protein
MEYKYKACDEERVVKIDGPREAMLATLDDRVMELGVTTVSDGCLLLNLNGKNYQVRYARDTQGIHLTVKGVSLFAKAQGQDKAARAGAEYDVVDGKQILVAPMPGQVVKVNVGIGDKVEKKQCLVIVEAMKMENELRTAIDGTVTAIHVDPGQQVGAMQALVEVTQTLPS